VELFASGEASVETSDEARVNCHKTERLFRLFRAAIYQTRSVEPIVLDPEDIAEFESLHYGRAERVDVTSAADLLAHVQTAQFAEICPVEGV